MEWLENKCKEDDVEVALNRVKMIMLQSVTRVDGVIVIFLLGKGCRNVAMGDDSEGSEGKWLSGPQSVRYQSIPRQH